MFMKGINEIKLFVFKTAVIVVLFFIVDSIIASIIREKLTNNYVNESCEVYTLLTKATPEILILGASDAHQSYSPSVFSDTLGLSCYNGAISQQGILQNYLIAKAIIDRKKTKIIILNFLPSFFDGFGSNMAKIRPSYYDNIDVKKTLDSLDFYMPIKQFIPGYKYNSLIINIAESVIKPVPHENGFYPMRPGKLKEKKKILFENKYSEDFDKKYVQIFENFVKYCALNKISLYVISSPKFYYLPKPHPYNLIVSKICSNYKVPFIDYSQNEKIVNNPLNFRDQTHLSYIGAPLFSKIVASRIKKMEIIKAKIK